MRTFFSRRRGYQRRLPRLTHCDKHFVRLQRNQIRRCVPHVTYPKVFEILLLFRLTLRGRKLTSCNVIETFQYWRRSFLTGVSVARDTKTLRINQSFHITPSEFVFALKAAAARNHKQRVEKKAKRTPMSTVRLI